MALSTGIRLHQYLNDWLIRAQSQEEAQVNTQTVVDLTVLRVDNKSGEVRTKTNSGVFLRGLRIPSRFSPCKTHSREMAQTSGFDPTTQVKTCFDCKMFEVTNWVACFNGENAPRGTPPYEALSVSPQGTLEIFSVVGHPPSLDRNHFSTPRLVAKSHKRDEMLRPSSQRLQYPILYRHLNQRLGHSPGAHLCKRSVVRQGERATHKCSRAEGGFSGPSLPSLPDNTKPRHIPGCLNVITELLSRSNQVQSTESSLHPQVFKQICLKWFTPHVDLFATRLNHKVPLYVSPVPGQNSWDTDALNINWSGLTAYAYPPTALLHRVIQKVRQSNCLIIIIAPGWPGMPWLCQLTCQSADIMASLCGMDVRVHIRVSIFSNESTRPRNMLFF